MSDSTVTGAETPEQPHTTPVQPAAEQLAPEQQPAAGRFAPGPFTPEQPAPVAPRPRPASGRLLRAGAATVAAALVGVVIGIGIIKTQYDDPAPGAPPPPPPAAAELSLGRRGEGEPPQPHGEFEALVDSQHA
ncbi:hypothetical protein ACFV4F_18820, partial [Kitasatospora sp. NPDC059722]